MTAKSGPPQDLSKVGHLLAAKIRPTVFLIICYCDDIFLNGRQVSALITPQWKVL